MKVFGVVLDQRLAFAKLRRVVLYHAQAVRRIRHLLTPDLAQTLVCSLILSSINYCNALLHGTSAAMIRKLQHRASSALRRDDPAPSRNFADCTGCRSSRGSSTFKVRNTATATTTYRHATVRGIFARLALHCWHNLPGELTSRHELPLLGTCCLELTS